MAEEQKSYDCNVCPAYCCCLPEIAVTEADIARLAERFAIDAEQARQEFTAPHPRNGDETILRQKPDAIYGTACRFLDSETRACTVYEARPAVCRAVPGGSRCGYYEFLMSERESRGDPNHVALLDPLLEDGLNAYRAGRFDEAIGIFHRVLDVAPLYSDAHHLLGLAYLMTNAVEDGIGHLRRAVELAPHRAPFHVSLGNGLQETGRLAESLEAYDAALEADPDNAGALVNRGYALYDLNRLEEAAQAHRRALERHPDMLEALNGLGVALQELRRFEEAATCFEKAIAVDPSHVALHNNLGTVLRLQGRLDEASARYREALAIDPENPGVLGNIGLTQMEQGDLDAARESYAEAAALGIADADTWVSYHALVYRDDDKEPAAAMLEEALNCDPRHATAHFHLGVIKEQGGDTEGAAAAHFAMLGRDRQGYNPMLDSWEYAKAHRTPATRYFKTTRETLDYCLDQAETEGLALEFGVRFGATIRMLAARAGQMVHGFDSFEGLPEAWYGLEGQYSTHGALPPVPDNVTLHQGWFEDSLPEFLAEHAGPVRFMHVDCDLYSSTVTIFDRVGPYIQEGTVIVFDEYLINEAWREDEFKAFQEAVARFGWEYEYLAFGFLTKQAGVRINRVGAGRAPSSSADRGRPMDREPVDRFPVPPRGSTEDAADALLSEGYGLHRRGEIEQALARYRRALAVAPENPDALYLAGVALFQNRAFAEAETLLETAARLDPRRADVLINLGNCRHLRNNLGEAETALRRAIAIDPSIPEAHNNLGNVLKELDRLEDAEASYRRALALEPGDPPATRNLADLLGNQNRFEDAETVIRRALALGGDDGALLFCLGRVLKELDRLDEAVEAYRRALALDPGNAEAAFGLHAVIYDERNPEPAVAALESAVAADPDNERVRLFLGVLYEQMGKTEEAALHFARLPRTPAGPHPWIDSWEYVKANRGPDTRLLALTTATLRHALAQATVDGLVLEFGVYYGATLRLIAGRTDRTVHGFDSFAGLPEDWRDKPAGAYSTRGARPRVPANAILHAGWFEDTLPGFLAEHPGPVRFLHVDCDLYSSTATIFKRLGPRIVPGTVIVFDEYLINEAWREDEFKAFQEAAAEHAWQYEYIAFSLFSKQAAVRIVSTGS